MADSYVCSGATMRCTMGEKPAKLTVLPTRTVFLCGQPMANISDHKSMVNLASFGRCRSLGYPATAAATAAHHGHLTPMPCVHNTPIPWVNGKTDYIIKGQPALLKSCKCQCIWGGMISIIDDGQKDTGAVDIDRVAKDLSKHPESGDVTGLSADAVLDGIQLALDAAGFVPGFGAIPDLINASISALRGNWTDAGMSLLAAVPLIGDVAAGVKIAKNGVKIAKDAKKVKGAQKTVKAIVRCAELGSGEKLVGKSSAKAVNQFWERIYSHSQAFHPPYKKGTDVLEIELTEKKTFVRLYDGMNSGRTGGWMMEKESIEGLTPKQIQDKYALPQIPKYIQDVEVSAGTRMHKGIAAEVKGWGNGGGIQYNLKDGIKDGIKEEPIYKNDRLFQILLTYEH